LSVSVSSSKHSSPNHPQTCGKVERFHQTLKKYLAKQKAAKTLAALQNQIERFVLYYNAEAPPSFAGAAHTPRGLMRPRSRPPRSRGVDRPLPGPHDKVDDAGSLTVRYQSKLFHIGMGRRFKGQSVSLLIADDDIRVLDTEGVLLRSLTLDPTRNYQPRASLGGLRCLDTSVADVLTDHIAPPAV